MVNLKHSTGYRKNITIKLLINSTDTESIFQDYAEQRMTPWIRRIKLRKRSTTDCSQLTWGEIKFAEHVTEHQLLQFSLPPQPSYVQQHLLHHEVQRSVLGYTPFQYSDVVV